MAREGWLVGWLEGGGDLQSMYVLSHWLDWSADSK